MAIIVARIGPCLGIPVARESVDYPPRFPIEREYSELLDATAAALDGVHDDPGGLR
jgi:hypothetical protein